MGAPSCRSPRRGEKEGSPWVGGQSPAWSDNFLWREGGLAGSTRWRPEEGGGDQGQASTVGLTWTLQGTPRENFRRDGREAEERAPRGARHLAPSIPHPQPCVPSLACVRGGGDGGVGKWGCPGRGRSSSPRLGPRSAGPAQIQHRRAGGSLAIGVRAPRPPRSPAAPPPFSVPTGFEGPRSRLSLALPLLPTPLPSPFFLPFAAVPRFSQSPLLPSRGGRSSSPPSQTKLWLRVPPSPACESGLRLPAPLPG